MCADYVQLQFAVHSIIQLFDCRQTSTCDQYKYIYKPHIHTYEYRKLARIYCNNFFFDPNPATVQITFRHTPTIIVII